MPYANVEDRKARSKARYAERRDEFRAYGNAAQARRMADPEYRERHNARARERLAERQEIIDRYKLDRGCTDCGYDADPIALDFDHVDEKRFSVADNGKRVSVARLLDELSRCEVVCANCHRIRTRERRCTESS